MKLDRRFDTVRATAILIVTLFTLAGLGACKDHFDEEERERPGQAKPAPTATSADNGQSYLTLDPSTQARLGLQVATLKAIVTREQTNAPAVVLSALDLVTFRNNCLAAQAQLQKSRIATDVAKKEFARLKSLFEQDQNISEKALQSAEGNLQASEADEHLDEEQLKLQEPLVRQKWGDAVAKWVVEGTPELQRIFNEQEALVQVTIPSAAPFGPPKALSLEIPGGMRMEASFVSPLPRIDPRIQGNVFLYRMAAYPGLSPGINLVSHFPIGEPMRGVVVPVSAVVWSEGKAWVYEQTAADRFTRHPVTTDNPVEEGFLVTAGLSAGDKIVTQGAQDLLSEELLAHSQQGIETDDD